MSGYAIHHRTSLGERCLLNRERILALVTGPAVAMLFMLPGNRLMGQNCAASSVGFPPLVEPAQEPHLGLYDLGLFPGWRNFPPTTRGQEGVERALGTQFH